MARHVLTDTALRNAKPKDKPYRLRDGDGLFLYVPPSGVRAWHLRYIHDGKEQVATLGKVSDVQGLAWARAKADEARELVATGKHFTVEKRVARVRKAADTAATFAMLAADWVKIEARRAGWTPAYKVEVEASLRNHLAKLNPIPLTEISAAVASPILRRVERLAPDMASKVRQRLRAIMDYAAEHGVIASNPIPPARRRSRAERKNLPAVLDHNGVGEILRAADVAELTRGVRRAHLLVTFTVQRVGEVVGAQWSEVDLKAGTWAIPRERMKRKDKERGPHEVPLPPALLTMMREWRRADGDKATYVCPAPRNDKEHVTRESVEKFYRRGLGLTGKHSPHSWRSVFSTWSREAGHNGDVVEAQLDHVVGNKVAAAYDRAKRLTLRCALMRWYEAQLIAARDGARVLQLKAPTFPNRAKP